MTKTLDTDIRTVRTNMESQDIQDNTQPPPEGIQDVYVLIVREQEADHTHIVDSTPIVTTQPAPVTMQHDSFLSAYVFVCCSFFLIFATLAFQLYCLVNPSTATITLIPKSQQVMLSGTVQLGRVLPPLTISQWQTTKATGTGHQDAKQATGTVTFYNGLFTQQFVTRGTVYTGQGGVAIVTTQEATIPPGNPSAGYGTATVTAQATAAGTSGNIQTGDISITINNGLLVRNNEFRGGQNARTYTTVTRNDIHNISTVLKTTIAQSINGALHGQLQPAEQLQLLPCRPTVTSDHQAGEEATTVTVTVSQSCTAVAYNSQTLAQKATALLTSHALQTTGAGYSLFGSVHVWVKQATESSTPHPLVFLSFQARGTWVYALSGAAQQQIKHLIAGRTTQEAVQLLASLPGIEHATLRIAGFGDATRVPKNTGYIQIALFVV
jgi:hypothetical protein